MYYFDNAASTKPYDEVIDYYAQISKNIYANPSALHKFGYEAAKLVEEAKEKLLSVYNLKDYDAVFTSGATESANLAIKGTIEKYEDITKTHIVTTGIEHACVTQPCLYLEERGVKVSFLGVDSFGRIDISELENVLNKNTKLVSIIWVNNENGIIQDIKAIAETVKSVCPQALLHLDATQGFGNIPADLSVADLISVSAHKFHGPKGIGALFIKKGVSLNCVEHGGGQQNGLRSGTINAPMIAALGKTCELTDVFSTNRVLKERQRYLYGALEKTFGSDVINSRIFESDYAPHILSISFPSLKGEVLLHMLESSDIYVSTSSACSSHKKIKSVLANLGFTQEKITGTLRLSISEFTTEEEIDFLVKKLDEAVGTLNLLRGKK